MEISPTRRLPYPGLDPFGFGQQDLFFGRDQEGRAVAAMVAAQPLSVLTGASGTGKSSLLRAMVMPTLMSRGWCVVYAQPGSDPVKELRDEMLDQAVPEPSREIRLIDRVLAAQDKSDKHALSEQSDLSDAHRWYEALAHDDARRADVMIEADAKIPRIPLLASVLAGVVPPARAVALFAALGGPRESPSQREVTFKEIRLLQDRASEERKRICTALTVDEPPLAELAGRLWRDWLFPISARGLVLILDQAEELYTAFGASRASFAMQYATEPIPGHEPKLRDRLFEALPDLLKAAEDYPLRMCISLRPEWYTELRISAGASMPDETTALHILTRMSRDQADAAIEKPANTVGGKIEEDAKIVVLNSLEAEGEGRGLDPFLLALICRIAWEFAVQAPSVTEATSSVGTPILERIVGGPPDFAGGFSATTASTPALVRGALLWLLHHLFEQLDNDERFDALEVLNALFTASGTRRIVAERELIERPLRPSKKFQMLIGKMEEERIVRRFQRGTELFVEIRHERLSEPLLAYKARLDAAEDHSLSATNRYRVLLNRALDILVHYDGKRLNDLVADGLQADVLPGWAREALRYNRASVAWDQPAARAFLSSLLYEGPARSDVNKTEYRDALRELMIKAYASRLPDLDSQRSRLQDNLLRGAQIKRADLDRTPEAEIHKLPIDARLLLLDSILTQIESRSRDSQTRKEVLEWIGKCLGMPTLR